MSNQMVLGYKAQQVKQYWKNDDHFGAKEPCPPKPCEAENALVTAARILSPFTTNGATTLEHPLQPLVQL